MSFSLYLKNKISKNKINRSDLIAQLNLYHKEFNNLDAITFSRWITNKTTPSPYKQILISNYFNDNILLFIKKDISLKKEAKVVDYQFDRIMKRIDNSYTNINYLFRNNIPEYYSTEKINNTEFLFYFNEYYNNFELYRKILISINNNKKHEHFSIIKRKKEFITSHIITRKIDSSLAKTIKEQFNYDIPQDEFIVDIAYIEDRKSYLFMKSILLNFFYTNSIESFTCIIRGDFLDFLTLLPYEQIGIVYHDKKHKLYLLRADILKLISHPFIIKMLNNNLDYIPNTNNNIKIKNW
ncbi:TPA: hypothetical protein ACX6Q1_001077 [Photobacterium damselae]